MNLRALMLLAAVLLMQAGQGLALTGRGAGPDSGHDAMCAIGCCGTLAGGDTCCCVEAPASAPESQPASPLPVSGRERAPQPVMTLVATLEVPSPAAHASDGARFHRAAPCSIAAPAVPLTVLHCAFLI